MIDIQHLTVRYKQTDAPVLADVNAVINEGQLLLVTGRTGSGKSTLLGALNGHVPRFTGGIINGRVLVDGRDTADYHPNELADVIGVVAQDPARAFVADTVEAELAFGLEQLGLAPAVMRTRVEETMDILGLADLRDRALTSLSGGQQQRVAIGAVLATGVRALVLDEPTSALDPVSSEDVLAALMRLVHDLGLLVIIAEHRLERVIAYADQLMLVESGRVRVGDPAQMLAESALVPPLVELGRVADFPQVPLSVRQARAMAGGLRHRLAIIGQPASTFPRQPVVSKMPIGSSATATTSGPANLHLANVSLGYGEQLVVDNCSWQAQAGQVTVLMGRNGSGKSTLLLALAGVMAPRRGEIRLGEQDLTALSGRARRRALRLVPQQAGDLLYLDSVAAECAVADRDADRPAGRCAAILESLVPGIPAGRHPRDLSEGQRLALVLAIQLTPEPAAIWLDEPTRGLDYPAKAALAAQLAALAAAGRQVGVVTHDVEFAAAVADQIILLSAGEVIAQDSAQAVLGSSALFASQVAKVLYPAGWLTPFQVGQALAGDHD
ncbi:MAG: ATP-binding cassette domain-containing protein [Propionibacteriaceae bacterium]|jgi:energy-coupling factor transport system ATP-binding protein|nr:ATP-binding cassette domain-containing protein [Propionibacteriaceae bacterium]